MHTPALVALAVAFCTTSIGAQGISKPTPAAIDHAAEFSKARASAQSNAQLRPIVRASSAPQPALPSAPQAPSADDCTTPDVIVGTGNIPFDNSTATTGTQGQTEAQCDLASAGTSILNDVWFTWNAPSSGLARFTTCGLTTVDTKIAVYSGTTCPAAGTAIACNDDACVGLQSTVEFTCTGGADYVIQLGNYPGQFPPALPGSGALDVEVLSSPSNDDCATPQAVVGLTSVSFDNSLATTGAEGQFEAICFALGGTAVRRDLWYAWTAPFTGAASLRTCGSSLDTKIAVYDGSGCPTGSAIACNDDACGLQSRVIFPCASGQTYTFQIGLYQGINTGGPGTFEVSAANPPANDSCAAALTISGSGPFPFDDTDATTGSEGQSEAQCNQQGGTAIHADLWFVWTAATSGTYLVQDLGLTGVDTKIAVYDRAGCPTVPSKACSDDANEPNNVYLQSQAIFLAFGGSTYTIQIGLSATAFVGGAGQFSIRLYGAPANDDCASAAPIAGPGPHAFDNTQATTGLEGQADSACDIFGSASVPEDVWYAWTAGSNGTATLTLCGLTTIDTKVAVYDGAGCPAAAALACNDDACGPIGYQSQVDFPVTCGQAYTIQLGVYPLYGAPAGGEGGFTVTIAGGGSCSTGTVFCAGDGVAPHTSCPCGNNSAPGDDVGCVNTLGTGGKLRATGVASVSGDTLVLAGTQMANSTSLYFQGTTQAAGGNGAAFGDGLRCAGGTQVRLGTAANIAGASQYPGAGNLAVSIRGHVPAAGGTRTYQCWYRNAAPFCTPSTFNLTNGLEIVWLP